MFGLIARVVASGEVTDDGSSDAGQGNPEDWRTTPAHQSAAIVHAEVADAFHRQLAYLGELDTKGSFVVAGVVAVLVAAVALGHVPQGPHAQDLAGMAIFFLLGALVGGCFTWWPRQAGDVPNPRYTRERHWNAIAEHVLRDITDQRVHQYEGNLRVVRRKVLGLRLSIFCLPLGVIFGFASLMISGH